MESTSPAEFLSSKELIVLLTIGYERIISDSVSMGLLVFVNPPKSPTLSAILASEDSDEAASLLVKTNLPWDS